MFNKTHGLTDLKEQFLSAQLAAMLAAPMPSMSPSPRRRRWKDPNMSATGSITKTERADRNKKKKAAEASRRKNRK